MAIMLLLVVLAYLLVPLGLAIPYNVLFMLAILGIVAFFGLSFPVQQPAGFSTLLKVGLLLIGAGILARILPTMLLLRSALELIDITVSTERSFAVATVPLSAGLVTLTTYWILYYVDLKQN